MKRTAVYPFTAIVGQEEMKLSLILNVIESRKRFDHIILIEHTGCFTNRVHGPHGVTYIYSAHFHLRQEDIS